jgi:anti-anti-sigma regulatory factor
MPSAQPPSLLSPSAGPSLDDATATPLEVSVVRDERGWCTASFRGALVAATRSTIDAVVGVLAGEASVLLDLAEVDRVDNSGARAVAAMAISMRAQGGRLRIVNPSRADWSFPYSRGPRLTGSLPSGLAW